MIKRPETFEDILNLQKHLDESIHSARPRTLRDIKLSLIAECVEFNEETPQSHKTWKTKEYNKDRELEELTDIFFFYAQLINFNIDNDDTVDNYDRIKRLAAVDFDNWANKIYITLSLPILNLISNIIDDRVLHAIDDLIEISKKLNYTKDDILNCYWEKWQKNMSRIGKEWN